VRVCVRSPLLLEDVLQHLDASHQVVLQVLLAPPLALQEGNLGLEGTQEVRMEVITSFYHRGP